MKVALFVLAAMVAGILALKAIFAIAAVTWWLLIGAAFGIGVWEGAKSLRRTLR